MAKTTPDCPRCSLSMTPSTYEGATVLICPSCWGYYVTAASLEKILVSPASVFSEAEKATALLRQKAEDADADATVSCPECAKQMQKRDLDDALLYDVCVGHGVWLDTGEIKRIQILAESSPERLQEVLQAVKTGAGD